MKHIPFITLIILTPLLLIFDYASEKSIDGCYLMREKISNYNTEESEIKTSYINILKTDQGLVTEGVIWGGNFHICNITAPFIDENNSFDITYDGNELKYNYSDTENDITCNFSIISKNNKIVLKDSNSHCSDYIFFCGRNAKIDGIELFRKNNECYQTN